MQARYAEEPFVHVMDKGGIPHTRYVRGTNYNFISVFPDRLPGRAIIISGARTVPRMLLPHAAWHGWVSSGRVSEDGLSHVCVSADVMQDSHYE